MWCAADANRGVIHRARLCLGGGDEVFQCFKALAWPRCRAISSKIGRAAVSIAVPGPNGTTAVIVRLGHGWADAAADNMIAENSASPRSARPYGAFVQTIIDSSPFVMPAVTPISST